MGPPKEMHPRAILETFDQSLTRETHNLLRWPELTWQQLHNRLQWEGQIIEEKLSLQRERASGPSGHPWIRTWTKLRLLHAKVCLLSLTRQTLPGNVVLFGTAPVEGLFPRAFASAALLVARRTTVWCAGHSCGRGPDGPGLMFQSMDEGRRFDIGRASSCRGCQGGRRSVDVREWPDCNQDVHRER